MYYKSDRLLKLNWYSFKKMCLKSSCSKSVNKRTEATYVIPYGHKTQNAPLWKRHYSSNKHSSSVSRLKYRYKYSCIVVNCYTTLTKYTIYVIYKKHTFNMSLCLPLCIFYIGDLTMFLWSVVQYSSQDWNITTYNQQHLRESMY